MEKMIRFFCACAPGIAIGLWLARQLGWWWPLGAVSGAMISYFLVEWKVVIKAVPQALRQTFSGFSDWFMDAQMWKACGMVCLGFLSYTLSSGLFLLANAWCGSNFLDLPISKCFYMANSQLVRMPFFWGLLYSVSFIFGSIIALILFILSIYSSVIIFGRRLKPHESFDNDVLNFFQSLVRFANPLAVFIYWPAKGLMYTPKGIKWLAPRLAHVVWEILLFFFNFSRAMIIITHSQRHTLCATVTFMTVVLGYVANGDILTFTLAGGLIGAVYSGSHLKEWVLFVAKPKPQPA